MTRMLSALMAACLIAACSVGCCTTCGSCGHGGCKYWRNLGKPGKHPVGKTWCHKCDLCDDVGGPCGGWSQTSTGGDGGCATCGEGEEIIHEEYAPTVSTRRVRSRAPVYSTPKTAMTGQVRRY